MTNVNDLEIPDGPFDPDLLRALGKRHVMAEHMAEELNRLQAISRGLREVFKIARNNALMEAADDGSAPLSPNCIESLLAMGEICAHQATVSIEDLATRARRFVPFACPEGDHE